MRAAAAEKRDILDPFRPIAWPKKRTPVLFRVPRGTGDKTGAIRVQMTATSSAGRFLRRKGGKATCPVVSIAKTKPIVPGATRRHCADSPGAGFLAWDPSRFGLPNRPWRPVALIEARYNIPHSGASAAVFNRLLLPLPICTGSGRLCSHLRLIATIPQTPGKTRASAGRAVIQPYGIQRIGG